VLGTAFVAVIDDTWTRRSIAVILLAMVMAQLCTRGRRGHHAAAELLESQTARPHWLLRMTMGALAGFATMVANAAGPVMTIYLIVAGLPLLQMLGTGAWFFLVVNLVKLQFSAGLSLVSLDSLMLDAALTPVLVAGAVIGIVVIRRVDRRHFERTALATSAVAAALLVHERTGGGPR